jgi:two-component system LytT family response regulator
VREAACHGRLAQPAALVRQLEALIEAHESTWLQRLVVRNGEHFDFVPVDLIDWIESANNYTVLHCRSKDYVFGENLSALERRLDPEQFLRVHRCHISISRGWRAST